VTILLVPCDPKNRVYRFFRDRQPPLGLEPGDRQFIDGAWRVEGSNGVQYAEDGGSCEVCGFGELGVCPNPDCARCTRSAARPSRANSPSGAALQNAVAVDGHLAQMAPTEAGAFSHTAAVWGPQYIASQPAEVRHEALAWYMVASMCAHFTVAALETSLYANAEVLPLSSTPRPPPMGPAHNAANFARLKADLALQEKLSRPCFRVLTGGVSMNKTHTAVYDSFQKTMLIGREGQSHASLIASSGVSSGSSGQRFVGGVMQFFDDGTMRFTPGSGSFAMEPVGAQRTVDAIRGLGISVGGVR